jgi:hypothetical protein
VKTKFSALERLVGDLHNPDDHLVTLMVYKEVVDFEI